MTCLGFIWHYFNVKLHIFFSICLLLELQSVSIHQFIQIPNTSVTRECNDNGSDFVVVEQGLPRPFREMYRNQIEHFFKLMEENGLLGKGIQQH